MASSTRVDPLCTGRWTWSHSVGTASIASTMSRPKSRGCEVETHAPDAGNFSHGGQQLGKSFSGSRIPFRILVRIHVLPEQLNFRVAEIGHLARFGEHRLRGAAA